MEENETVEGAVKALAASVEEFWPVLDGDTKLSKDDQAEITLLMEGVEDNLAAVKKLLHDISEMEG